MNKARPSDIKKYLKTYLLYFLIFLSYSLCCVLKLKKLLSEDRKMAILKLRKKFFGPSHIRNEFLA